MPLETIPLPPSLKERLGEEVAQELAQWLTAMWEAQSERRWRSLEEGQDQLKAALVALAEAQRRTEAGLQRLEVAVEQLAEAQHRTEGRLDRLGQVVAELAEAQRRTEARLEELAKAQQRTEARLDRLEDALERLAEAQQRTEEEIQKLAGVQSDMQATIAAIKGSLLEMVYRERAGTYLGPFLRRVQVFAPYKLEDEVGPHLTWEEFREFLRLDWVVKGRPRWVKEAPWVWLAMEVSAVVDRHDVERALKRVALLRKAGLLAMPAVAGEEATKGAVDMAEDEGVVVVVDGWARFWEKAWEQAQKEASKSAKERADGGDVGPEGADG